jgi:hypothetical protein
MLGMKTEAWFRGMSQLEGHLNSRDTKYRRNYRLYTDSYRGEEIRRPRSEPLGFYYSVEENMDRPPPVINAAKSAVDTVVSTMSQLKTRPFINPVNGKFDTRRASRDVQRYIDALFDKENVYTQSPEVLRAACIFEAGVFFIDDINNCIRRIRPWEVYFSPEEYQFGCLYRYHFRFDHYPVAALENYIAAEGKDPTGFKRRFRQRLDGDMYSTCTYRIAYDLKNKVRIEMMDEYEVSRKPISFDEPNFTQLYFKEPIKGEYSMSLIDDVYTIQLQINDICRKISTAFNLTPANFVLIPKGMGQVKPSMIKSDVGYVYEFTSIAGAPPISIVSPAPIDPSYVSVLQFFIEQLFKQPGVSDMQALGERPASVQSGYAIDTLNNIFSNRQNVILLNYLRMQVDLARKVIKCYSPDFKLPSVRGGKYTTMGEVQAEMDRMTIDIAATSSLSRDPKTKQEQIQNLVGSGLMSSSIAAQYLEMPDLEDAYSVLTSAQDYNRWIIERVVKEGKLDFYQVTDMTDLFQLAISELLQCASAGEGEEVMKRLSDFIEILQAQEMVMQAPAPVPVQPGMGQQPPQQGAPGQGAIPQGVQNG